MGRQGDEWRKKIKEVEEEGRLGREELELRLSAVAKVEDKFRTRILKEQFLQLKSEKKLNLSKKEIIELESLKSKNE